MQLATVHAQNTRVGTCPHGLPLGACPICNGMMGGGGGKRADFSAKPGEMSWNECAAIGAFLRAQKAAQQAKNSDYMVHVQNLIKFQNAMANAAQRAADFAKMVSNTMPAIIAKPVAFVMNNIVVNVLNGIKNLPTAIANFAQNFAQKLADIADKLTAVYGELKAAIEKKVSEFIGSFKKKVKSLFAIFEPFDADDDDKKVDETKRAFELKTFIHKLYKKLTESDENEHQSA